MSIGLFRKALPKAALADADARLRVDDRLLPIHIHRSARARGYRLTLARDGEGLRLSMPARASLSRALKWAQGHEDWVRAQLAKAPQPIALAHGATFLLEGREVQIACDPARPREVVLDGETLHVGGPIDTAAPRLLRWLKARAKRILERETRSLAQAHGLPLTTVGIGDPRTRWGSCASSGAIRYSWRLILAPPDVRLATVAHECAHLLHMDHSPAFHAAHARLLGADPKPARAWLRAHGAALHRVGI